MSHPVPGHEYGENEHPDGASSSYPHKKEGQRRAKKTGPLHNVANRLTARARALRKRMQETGGRFTK